MKAETATWAVPGDDRDIVGRQLGSSCRYDLDEVPAVIVEEQGDGREAEIVTSAADGCAPLHLVVARGELART
jgi:hypothetical protein